MSDAPSRPDPELPDLSRFPATFRWGAATASYQTEGAVAEGDRIPSIWDTYSHLPGTVQGDDSGDIANDHYHRVDQDIDLMTRLGLQAYRFSIAWPRITDASGRANQRGIDFYSRLVDGLLAAGIEPVATLYHWDLPQYLEDAGGWTNPETAHRMADYSAIIAAALGDRVQTWTTLNEPWCSAYLGYYLGMNAPGRTEPLAALQAAHHLNLAHGASAAALRSVLPAAAQVSLTLNLQQFRPATDSADDHDAVRRADAVANRIFLEPVLSGRYPDDLIAETAPITDWSFVGADDLTTIAARPDVLGLNYYTPTLVTGSPQVAAIARAGRAHGIGIWPGTQNVCALPHAGAQTDMGWTIDPTGLADLLLRVHHDYPGLPLMVTENGAGYDDSVVDGTVDDRARAEYLRGHIDAVGTAIEHGADVRGYFVWSLMDVFEWSAGYDWRLGIIHVDRNTLGRTIKKSGYWYRDLIARFRAGNGVS